MTVLYDIIFLIFTLMYLPCFLLRKKFHRALWQRLGFYPPEVRKATGAIWIHAVSAGEVMAIRPFWEKLRAQYPSRKIIVSTVTKTGNEFARKFSRPGEIVFYLPLDFGFITYRLVRTMSPSALVIVETELWPNLICACSKNNVPVFLVNGRISAKAFKRYRLVKPLLGRVLKKISMFCVREKQDLDRFVLLGAPAGRVKLTGNIKYSSAKAIRVTRSPQEIKAAFGIGPGELVFTAASTHKGEEEIAFGVFNALLKEFNNLRLVIVPRHCERAPAIKKIIGEENTAVTVVDKMGVLNDLYSVSDVVFVGGSLIRHGGQNIIEPAVFARPILFGPNMFNFKDVARQFLKNNAAIMVRSAEELEANCRRLLSSPGERSRLGENSRRVVLNNQGADEKCILELKKILGNA